MKRLFLLCCCLVAAVPFSARGESLERALRAVTDSVRATVGVAVVFGDGDTLAVNGGRCYPMLSVCKFHQALAVLDRLVFPSRHAFRSAVPICFPVRGRRCAKPAPGAAGSPWRNC